jgi:2-C-methyl-D-erythritol 4-phosphate cytidylyltransferase
MATALIAAGGSGKRLGGDAPKALVPLAGRPLVAWSLAELAASESVERVVIAAPAGVEGQLETLIADLEPGIGVLEATVVLGGPSRSRSVANALAAAGGDAVVVVHDAARPLLTAALVDRCVERLLAWRCDGVVAAARATDTVKEADAGGRVIATLERANLWAIQTPQAFRADALRRAVASGAVDRAYDDAQLVEAAGGDVRIVEAPRENLKVTTPFDLRIAELLLSERLSRG